MRLLFPRNASGFRRRVHVCHERDWTNQKFDESTGQVYSETTAAIQSSDDQGWDRISRVVRGPSYRDDQLYEEYVKNWDKSKAPENLGEYQRYLDGVKNSKVRGLKGARSLQDAAIECLLQNISEITLEAIECLPNQIVRQLWHAINQRCTMCFNTWNIFSKILCDTETPTLDLLRYRQTIVQPKSALPVYASVVTSPTYDFITSLSITVDIPVPQLVRLTSIANLGVLEISKGKDTLRYDGQVQLAQGVSDRIIRAWQLAASTHGAFRVLRILRLWGHDEVTVNSLELVSMFPGLAVYDVGGCNFASAESQVQARNHGWAIAPTVKILELLDEMCKQRAIWMQDHVSKVKSTHRPRSRPLWDEAIVNWVPRAKVPECFHQTKSEEPPERTLKIKPSKRKHAEKVDVNNMLAALDRPREHRNISSRRLEQAQASMAKVAETKPPKTWDFEAYAAFARIGELRGDSDLARAGVIIGDQAVVGDQLVNSVRMASLHLGPTNFLSSANSKGPIFTRWEAPAPSDLALMRASLIAREAPSVAKKPQPSVMKSKKRKLDDVLGSFF